MDASNNARETGGQQSLPPIGIAVMGATGSGKTTFINSASGSDLRVGMSLKSCTADVQVANEFTVDGRRVVLIDTPGFDDTNVSDAEILKKIAAFLAATYQEGSKLAGIIYIHRISDERFTGMSVRNFRMFRELCGESSLKNVVLVTNMWGKVEPGVGEARERELSDIYLKPALDKNAQLARHYNTTQSAHDIIRRIMKNDPAPLRIQEELVDEGKNIEDTAAGEAINEEINRLIKRHEAEMSTLRDEMAQAIKDKDAETRKELQEESRKLQAQVDKMKADSVSMTAKFDEERKNMAASMARMEEDARVEREKAQAEHTRQINELKAQLQNTGFSSEERTSMLARIAELEQRGPQIVYRRRGCLIM